MKSHFGRRIKVLDLGCAGGQLVMDFVSAGQLAVGLDGSDYSIINRRACWPHMYGKHLFTCDISREFQVLWDQEKDDWNLVPMTFDVISAFEVIEHVQFDRMDIFLQNIKKHLAPSGMFLGSISMISEIQGGLQLHQSIHTKDEWYTIFSKYFDIEDNNFIRVRDEANSFHVKLSIKT